MPQFIRHTTLPLRTRNPGPHAMHGFGQTPAPHIQLHLDLSKLSDTQLQNIRNNITSQQACVGSAWLNGAWVNGKCVSASAGACATAHGYWNPATSQCLATPPATGISAIPTWAWLLGGAAAAGAAWYAFGR